MSATRIELVDSRLKDKILIVDVIARGEQYSPGQGWVRITRQENFRTSPPTFTEMYGKSGSLSREDLFHLLSPEFHREEIKNNAAMGDGVAARSIDFLQGIPVNHDPKSLTVTLQSENPGSLIGKGGEIVRVLTGLVKQEERITRINVEKMDRRQQRQSVPGSGSTGRGQGNEAIRKLTISGERIEPLLHGIVGEPSWSRKTTFFSLPNSTEAVYLSDVEIARLQAAWDEMGKVLTDLAVQNHNNSGPFTRSHTLQFNGAAVESAQAAVQQFRAIATPVLEAASRRINITKYSLPSSDVLGNLLLGGDIRYPIAITDPEGVEHRYEQKSEAFSSAVNALHQAFDAELKERCVAHGYGDYGRTFRSFAPEQQAEIDALLDTYRKKLQEVPRQIMAQQNQFQPLQELLKAHGIDFQPTTSKTIDEALKSPETARQVRTALVVSACLNEWPMTPEKGAKIVEGQSIDLPTMANDADGANRKFLCDMLYSLAKIPKEGTSFSEVQQMAAAGGNAPEVKALLEKTRTLREHCQAVEGVWRDAPATIAQALSDTSLLPAQFAKYEFDSGYEGDYLSPDERLFVPGGQMRRPSWDYKGHADIGTYEGNPAQLVLAARIIREAVTLYCEDVLHQKAPAASQMSLTVQGVHTLSIKMDNNKPFFHEIWSKLDALKIPGLSISTRMGELTIEYDPENLAASNFHAQLKKSRELYYEARAHPEKVEPMHRELQEAQNHFEQVATAPLGEVAPEFARWKEEARQCIAKAESAGQAAPKIVLPEVGDEKSAYAVCELRTMKAGMPVERWKKEDGTEIPAICVGKPPSNDLKYIEVELSGADRQLWERGEAVTVTAATIVQGDGSYKLRKAEAVTDPAHCIAVCRPEFNSPDVVSAFSGDFVGKQDGIIGKEAVFGDFPGTVLVKNGHRYRGDDQHLVALMPAGAVFRISGSRDYSQERRGMYYAFDGDIIRSARLSERRASIADPLRPQQELDIPSDLPSHPAYTIAESWENGLKAEGTAGIKVRAIKIAGENVPMIQVGDSDERDSLMQCLVPVQLTPANEEKFQRGEEVHVHAAALLERPGKNPIFIEAESATDRGKYLGVFLPPQYIRGKQSYTLTGDYKSGSDANDFECHDFPGQVVLESGYANSRRLLAAVPANTVVRYSVSGKTDRQYFLHFDGEALESDIHTANFKSAAKTEAAGRSETPSAGESPAPEGVGNEGTVDFTIADLMAKWGAKDGGGGKKRR